MVHTMDAIQIIKNRVVLSLPKEEIRVLRNALCVVCIEIEEWEFETRLGNYLQDAKTLLLKSFERRNHYCACDKLQF